MITAISQINIWHNSLFNTISIIKQPLPGITQKSSNKSLFPLGSLDQMWLASNTKLQNYNKFMDL